METHGLFGKVKFPCADDSKDHADSLQNINH